MDGILLIDKPKYWSSFDVVAKVRGILRTAIRNQKIETSEQQLVPSSKKIKVGHTGTLDPLATGLMIIVLGQYCKRAQEFSKLNKTYEVTVTLGQTSTTGDEEGAKTKSSKQRAVSKEDIEQVLQSFVGKISQVPPAYSAIKVNGQRAYKLARAGKEVKLEPRQVTVNTLQITCYNYPLMTCTAEVSSGTYIRSLVADIGESLGVGAYMSDLRRTQVGAFTVEDAQPIEGLTAQAINSAILTP